MPAAAVIVADCFSRYLLDWIPKRVNRLLSLINSTLAPNATDVVKNAKGQPAFLCGVVNAPSTSNTVQEIISSPFSCAIPLLDLYSSPVLFSSTLFCVVRFYVVMGAVTIGIVVAGVAFLLFSLSN